MYNIKYVIMVVINKFDILVFVCVLQFMYSTSTGLPLDCVYHTTCVCVLKWKHPGLMDLQI